uniref:Uncharacterized protein n=1 Tax=Arundo donax TaxID=35708 RepID=A0A0A9EDY4_ARUDO
MLRIGGVSSMLAVTRLSLA